MTRVAPMPINVLVVVLPPRARETIAGVMSRPTKFITLINGLIAGPAVSLNGSPTVSPMIVAAGQGKKIDSFVVRKAEKAHGLQRRIEGPDVKGKRVLAVEDTSTTGGSVLAAVEALIEAGAIVVGVAVIVERGAAPRVKPPTAS